MSENIQLPVEVVEEIKKNVAAKTNKEDERLRGGSKDYGRRISYLDGYETGGIAIATEYATKLHELQQENEELRRWKMEAVEFQIPIIAYAHKHLEVSLSDNISKLVIDHLNAARDLLNEVFQKHESGLLPDRFVYDKIKRFLYGE